MDQKTHLHLSRRERQIMDILYQRGSATAAEVREGLPKQPSYSAVRAMLRVLEEKGHVRHRQEGVRYVYAPTVPLDRAKRSALQHLVKTFFDGSAVQAAVALLDPVKSRLSPEEYERLSRLIERARKEGQRC